MEKIVYTIPEVAQLLGISRSYAYELVKRNEIPILKLGKRRMIPKQYLEQWIQKNTEFQSNKSHCY